MYGFVIPNAGIALITSLLAGEKLTLTRCMVGAGKIPADVDPATLTDLVQPVAQATSTVPSVSENQMKMMVEYRNDLNDGLETGFWLSEFGVFARGKDGAEVLLYYGGLDDYPQWVNPYTQGAIDVRRFPILIGVSHACTVVLEYHAGAFITADDIKNKYVERSGDSMEGNLIMCENATVTGIPDPIEGTDAVPLVYLQHRLQSLHTSFQNLIQGG